MYREPSVMGRKWPQINGLDQKEEINIQLEHNEESRIQKDKERILKAAREKETVTYKGVPIRLSADFSKETLQAKMHWKEVFKVMKRTYIQSYEKYSKL